MRAARSIPKITYAGARTARCFLDDLQRETSLDGFFLVCRLYAEKMTLASFIVEPDQNDIRLLENAFSLNFNVFLIQIPDIVGEDFERVVAKIGHHSVISGIIYNLE
jgi:hypothetical protein